MFIRDLKQTLIDGLWHHNPGLMQLLGLCPLLAISTTLINGLTLGIATLLTLIISNTCVSTMRRIISPEIRIPVFILIIASIVSGIELLMQAYFHALYTTLGLFIPLIVTNCAIMARAETYASKNALPAAALDGLVTGLGFATVLIALGTIREIIGFGTLFANIEFLFGENSKYLTITLTEQYRGFLLAVLPTGAFIGLALLIAAKRVLDKRYENNTETQETTLPHPKLHKSISYE